MVVPLPFFRLLYTNTRLPSLSPLLSSQSSPWNQPATPSVTSTRGNKRGRRPNRGRGRGGRALPPDQLIPLGVGFGVAQQAHINSAGEGPYFCNSRYYGSCSELVVR